MTLVFAGLQTQELSWLKSETGPLHGGQGEVKERGRFNKQGAYQGGCLRQPQYEQTSAPAQESLKSSYR